MESGQVLVKAPIHHKDSTITYIPHICPEDITSDWHEMCGVTEYTADALALIYSADRDGLINLGKRTRFEVALGKAIAARIKQALPDKLATIFSETGIVAGGCFASAISGRPINDIDVFVTNEVFIHKFADMVNQSLTKENRFTLTESDDGLMAVFPEGSDGITVGEGRRYVLAQLSVDEQITDGIKVLAIGPNAITIEVKDLPYAIQIVTRLIPQNVRALDDAFDFLHTKFFFDVFNNTLHGTEAAVNAAESRTLIYTGSKYPFSSMVRMAKYIRRGWSISPAQMFLIAKDLSNTNLDEPEALLDQLLSIDISYFLSVIGQVGLNADELVRIFKGEQPAR